MFLPPEKKERTSTFIFWEWMNLFSSESKQVHIFETTSSVGTEFQFQETLNLSRLLLDWYGAPKCKN